MTPRKTVRKKTSKKKATTKKTSKKATRKKTSKKRVTKKKATRKPLTKSDLDRLRKSAIPKKALDSLPNTPFNLAADALCISGKTLIYALMQFPDISIRKIPFASLYELILSSFDEIIPVKEEQAALASVYLKKLIPTDSVEISSEEGDVFINDVVYDFYKRDPFFPTYNQSRKYNDIVVISPVSETLSFRVHARYYPIADRIEIRETTTISGKTESIVIPKQTKNTHIIILMPDLSEQDQSIKAIEFGFNFGYQLAKTTNNKTPKIDAWNGSHAHELRERLVRRRMHLKKNCTNTNPAQIGALLKDSTSTDPLVKAFGVICSEVSTIRAQGRTKRSKAPNPREFVPTEVVRVAPKEVLTRSNQNI